MSERHGQKLFPFIFLYTSFQIVLVCCMLVTGKDIQVTAELIQVKNGNCKSHEYKIQCKYASMFTPPAHQISVK